MSRGKPEFGKVSSGQVLSYAWLFVAVALESKKPWDITGISSDNVEDRQIFIEETIDEKVDWSGIGHPLVVCVGITGDEQGGSRSFDQDQLITLLNSCRDELRQQRVAYRRTEALVLVCVRDAPVAREPMVEGRDREGLVAGAAGYLQSAGVNAKIIDIWQNWWMTHGVEPGREAASERQDTEQGKGQHGAVEGDPEHPAWLTHWLNLLDSDDSSERHRAAVSLTAETIELPELKQMAVSKLWSLILDPDREVASSAFGTLQRWSMTNGELASRLATLDGLLRAGREEGDRISESPHQRSMARPLSIEASTIQSAELFGRLDSLASRPPKSITEALRALRDIGRQFGALMSPWVSRVINSYKGKVYRSLEEKRQVGADITAAVKGFGLEVADPKTRVPGSLYARTGTCEEPGGRFTVEYPTERGTRTRTLDTDHPEVTLTESDTSVRKRRTPPAKPPQS